MLRIKMDKIESQVAPAEEADMAALNQWISRKNLARLFISGS